MLDKQCTILLELVFLVFVIHVSENASVSKVPTELVDSVNADEYFSGEPSCYKGAYRTGIGDDGTRVSTSDDSSFGWGACAGYTKCPPGNYCNDGVKRSCPPGTFGSDESLTTHACSGPCPAGYFCPLGTTNPIPCGTGNYCPLGSPAPFKISVGYYGLSDIDAISNSQAQRICDPGHYCRNGSRFVCPGGTYGGTSGLSQEGCSGICLAGFYCPSGSTSATEMQCGGAAYFCPAGSSRRGRVLLGGGVGPTHLNDGAHYSIGTTPGDLGLLQRERQKRCPAGSFCIGGIKSLCPAGRFGSRLGESNPLCEGPCMRGYFCPEGSVRKEEHNCGGPHHYCPTGSGAPVEAKSGFYTVELEPHEEIVLHDTVDYQRYQQKYGTGVRKTHERECEPGFYCMKGVRYECPIGRYGDTYGLVSSDCSGKCAGGSYCLKHSIKKDENDCGGPHLFCPPGTGVPKPVTLGYYTVDGPPNRRASEKHCELGHWCNVTTGERSECPAGRYGGHLGLHNDTCSGNCTPGFYCPPASVDKEQEMCGDPKHYCPGGASKRQLVDQGFYTFHGVEPPSYYSSEPLENGEKGQKFELKDFPDTRFMMHSDQQVCPLGSYCVLGLRHLCPAGKYGGVQGLSDSECNGNITEGYFGPPGSSSITEHECGGAAFFCPSGSGSPYPVSKGHYTWAPTTVLRNTNNTCHFNNTDTPNITHAEWSGWGITQYWEERTSNCTRYEDHNPNTTGDTMYLTLYNDNGAETTRTWQHPCPPGSYCLNGHLWEHPPGRYGRTNLSTTKNGTGPCAPGYYCPAGSTSPMQIPCGGPHVFCPENSGNPTPVWRGWYTSVGWEVVSNVTHPTVRHLLAPSDYHGNSHLKYEQKKCDVGHFCINGLRNACPPGRYAEKEGSFTEFCEGPCNDGYFCPAGSFSRTQYECGSPRGLAAAGATDPTSVYCPGTERSWNHSSHGGVDMSSHTGSAIPTQVSPGFYTIGGEGITNKTRFAEHLCPLGHYCSSGRLTRCPAGRYGGQEGLGDIGCSGKCAAGYFCPPGAWKSTQVQCGIGSRSPCYTLPSGAVATFRGGSGGGAGRTDQAGGERRCEYDQTKEYYRHVDLVQEFGQSGPWSRHHMETEHWLGIHPRQYHWHYWIRHPSRHRVPGEPSSVFCPEGTGVPRQVPRGWYTTGGNLFNITTYVVNGTNITNGTVLETNMTRTGAKKCEVGYFCEGGKKMRCPPGRYGNREGLTEAHCSAYCPAGFYCPWNTSVPVECPESTYSPRGVFGCLPCFQKPKQQETKQTCKDKRSCCNT